MRPAGGAGGERIFPKRPGQSAAAASLFVCTIIISCPKVQQQDIWCNTIAGSVPRGAPLRSRHSHRGSVQLWNARAEATGVYAAGATGPTVSSFCTGEPLISVMASRC